MEPFAAKLLIVGGMSVAAVALVAGSLWWRRRNGESNQEGVDETFLRRLGDGVGLDQYAERHYFGEQVRVLSGTFEGLHVELEVSSGDWPSYVRTRIQFPTLLSQDVTVLSEAPGTVVNRIRRLHEVEIGDDEFDSEFILYAESDKRLRRFFPASTRFQMVRLNRAVDDLRLSDQSLFLFARGPKSPREIRRIFNKALELADRLHETAREIGPAPSVVDVTSYEEAVEEKVAGSITEADRVEPETG